MSNELLLLIGTIYFMKRTFAIVFGLIQICFFATAQPVKEHGKLHVAGTQLTDEHGNAVILRGMSYGWHNLWPRFYNAGSVAWLHNDWGCTVVRAAMGVELNDSGYLKQPQFSTQKVAAVIDEAIKQGIYVIIDWHSHNIQTEAAKEFFAQMAARYGKYPNIIYEVFNEPDYESWPEVKTYATEVIKAIRAADPDNIILVGNPHWDQDINLVADDPLTGVSNIMYTVHYYAATHKQWLRDRCDNALNKGIPIFISECAGMEASGNGPLNLDEWNKWIAWSEARKISWVTWSVSDKDETCSVLQRTASADGGWKESDLKESGIIIRRKLRAFAGIE